MSGVCKFKNHYVATRQKLQDKADCLKQQLQQLADDQAALQAKVQVLCGIVQQTDTLSTELNRLYSFKQQGTTAGSVPICHASPTDAEASLQAAAEAAGRLELCGFQDNYCGKLLAAATPELCQRCLNMTPHDWCTYYSATAAKMCLLLEVLRREQRQSAASTAASAAALTSDTDANAAASNVTASPSIAVVAAAAAQLATAAKVVVPGATSLAATCTFQLNALLDELLTLILLEHVLNRGFNYRNALTVDLATGQRIDLIPAHHWQQVYQPLQLRPEQIASLAVLYEQFTRWRQHLRHKQSALCSDLAADTIKRLSELRVDADAAAAAAGAADVAATAANSHGSISAATTALIRSKYNAVAQDASAEVQGRRPPAAVATDPDGATPSIDGVVDQMQGMLTGLTTAALMLMAGFMNIVDRMQVVQFVASCYPYLPTLGSLFEVMNDEARKLRAEAEAAKSAAKRAASKAVALKRQQKQGKQHWQAMKRDKAHCSGQQQPDHEQQQSTLMNSHHAQLCSRQLQLQQQHAAFVSRYGALLGKQ